MIVGLLRLLIEGFPAIADDGQPVLRQVAQHAQAAATNMLEGQLLDPLRAASVWAAAFCRHLPGHL